MCRALVAVTLLGLLASPTASGAAPPPEEFMQRVLRLTVEGRYGAAWSLLHPAHQRVVSKRQLVRCRAGDPALAPHRLESSTVVAKRSIRLDAPGIPQRRSTRVVLRFRIADEVQVYPVAQAALNAVWTGTRWAWVLGRPTRCPRSATAAAPRNVRSTRRSTDGGAT